MLLSFHIWMGLTSSAPACPKRYLALVHCYILYALHEIRYLQILKIFILKTAIKLCVITFSAWLWKLHYSICQWSFPSWRHISNSCCSNTSDFLDVQHALQTQRNTPASVPCVLPQYLPKWWLSKQLYSGLWMQSVPWLKASNNNKSEYIHYACFCCLEKLRHSGNKPPNFIAF